jgi:hypothetical protein
MIFLNRTTMTHVQQTARFSDRNAANISKMTP